MVEHRAEPYTVLLLPRALKCIDRWSRKYTHIVDDIETFKENLKTNPFQGNNFKRGFKKVYWTSTDIPKGKRSGYRIYTFPVPSRKLVLILHISPKSAEDSKMSRHERQEMVKELLHEAKQFLAARDRTA